MTREEAIEVLSRPLYMKSTPQDVLDAHKMAIKILEQASCEDAISRADALKQIKEWRNNEFLRVANPYYYLEKRLNGLPSVNSAKEKAGQWIRISRYFHVCPECQEKFSYDVGAGMEITNYHICPNCGAKMESEE